MQAVASAFPVLCGCMHVPFFLRVKVSHVCMFHCFRMVDHNHPSTHLLPALFRTSSLLLLRSVSLVLAW